MVTWGNNTTTVFGASSPASTAAPGAPAPSTGFSFGASTPAPSTGFSFGASTPAPAAPSTPPTFSTPAPTIPPLGSSTPAASGFSFGASAPATPAPATGGLFGASTPAPATGGLFGTPAPAPSGGGLFGASTPAPAPSGGLFGSTPAPSTSLFGAPTPAPSTSLFGAPAPPAPPAFGGSLFPAPAAPSAFSQAPDQAALAAHQSAAQRQEAARIETALKDLFAKYSPHAPDPLNPALGPNAPNPSCRFSAILYDSLSPSDYPTVPGPLGSYGTALSKPKPPHVDNRIWNEALARNPDPNNLVPTAMVGAGELHKRIVSQQEKANGLGEHAGKLRESLEKLETAARQTQDSIRYSRTENEALRRRLLEVMRKVEIIRCMGHPLQRAEMDVATRLDGISKHINMLGKSLAEIEERGKQQARAWRMRATTLDSRLETDYSEAGHLDEEYKLELLRILSDQRLGMEHLIDIMKRDARDIDILKEELSKNPSSQKRLLLSGAAIFGGRS